MKIVLKTTLLELFGSELAFKLIVLLYEIIFKLELCDLSQKIKLFCFTSMRTLITIYKVP